MMYKASDKSEGKNGTDKARELCFRNGPNLKEIKRGINYATSNKDQ